MAGFVALNMVLAYRFRPMFRMPSPEQSGLERYRAAVTPIRIWLLVGVSLLLGLFAGTSATGQWRQFMLWRNGGDFGDTDPYFDRDIGFYVFDLNWLHYLVDSVMAFAVVGAADGGAGPLPLRRHPAPDRSTTGSPARPRSSSRCCSACSCSPRPSTTGSTGSTW